MAKMNFETGLGALLRGFEVGRGKPINYGFSENFGKWKTPPFNPRSPVPNMYQTQVSDGYAGEPPKSYPYEMDPVIDEYYDSQLDGGEPVYPPAEPEAPQSQSQYNSGAGIEDIQKRHQRFNQYTAERKQLSDDLYYGRISRDEYERRMQLLDSAYDQSKGR